MKIECIHYGHDKFDITQFNRIKNCNWIKPKGGLWASPVNSKYGWIDWGKENNFGRLDNSFNFIFDGNILIIDSLEDMENNIPFCSVDSRTLYSDCGIDFEKLSKNYDAMLLTINGEKQTRFSKPKNLYGWDCESICIFNPNGIIID